MLKSNFQTRKNEKQVEDDKKTHMKNNLPEDYYDYHLKTL